MIHLLSIYLHSRPSQLVVSVIEEWKAAILICHS